MNNGNIDHENDGFLGFREIKAWLRVPAIIVWRCLRRPRLGNRYIRTRSKIAFRQIWASLPGLRSVCDSPKRNIQAFWSHHRHYLSVKRTLSVAIVLWLGWIAVGGAIDLVDPFGVSKNSDKLALATLARIRAPFYKGPAVKPAVILITDKTLQENHISWPLPYIFYQKLFMTLARAQPSSIFLDAKIVDGRGTAKSRAKLRRSLQFVFRRFKFPIYVADIPGPNRDFFKGLPAVHALPVVFENRPGDYLLYKKKTAGTDRSAWRASPAITQYARACEKPNTPPCAKRLLEPARHDPLLVTWGESVASSWLPFSLMSPANQKTCRLVDPGFEDRLIASVRAVVESGMGDSVDEQRDRCSYIQYFPAQTLVPARPMTRDVLDYLKGRPLLIGFKVTGVNDVASSPVNGQVPGVFVHAAALDNLLYYGSDYPTYAPDSFRRLLFWLIAGLLLSIVLVSCRRAGIDRHMRRTAAVTFIVIVVVGDEIGFGHFFVDWPYLMLFIGAIAYFREKSADADKRRKRKELEHEGNA